MEVDKISALKPFDRYKYTVKKVVDFELIYALAQEDGTWALVEVEGKFIISLWPAAVYAQTNATDVWVNYQVLVISLDKLLSTCLESFEENGFLEGVGY